MTLKGIRMRRLFYASFAYMIIGVLSGLFYREFTKLNDFPEGQFTQLGLAHTHLLTLGFIVLLIVLGNVTTFGAAAALLVCVGFAMIICIASLNTLIQVTVADEMRARVMSMMTVSLFGLPTLGAWILGSLGDRIGITHALSIGGGVVALVALTIGLSSPEMTRTVRRHAATHP